MKWFGLFKLLLPVLSVALPQAAPLLPYIEDAVDAAQAIHGDTNNLAKKQLVLDSVAAVAATGAVAIDPQTAQAITNAVFDTVGNVKKIVQANQTPTPVVP